MKPVAQSGDRRVLVMFNPKSGVGQSLSTMVDALEKTMGRDAAISYQISHSVEDGQRKARRAIDEGIGALIVAGGDGMVNTIGSTLIGSDVALGVIPTGSGNGFARHFDIPLQPARAAEALAHAKPRRIDVGYVNDHPFFVTCGMAADAALVRHLEKSPVRGIFPYVLAAAYEIFEYQPQPVRVVLDEQEQVDLEDVLIFTVANLTQFGGGAVIAPSACADDGWLEMVVIRRQPPGELVKTVPRLFNGTLDQISSVTLRKFQRLQVYRERPGAIQVDGELLDAGAEVAVHVRPAALKVLVPGPVPTATA